MKKSVVVATANDWVGVYVDGSLVYQNHSIDECSMETVLEALAVPCESKIVDEDWLSNECQLPDSLNEVVFKA